LSVLSYACRFCATGEGRFQFFSEESKSIQGRLHSFATQKAGRGKGMPRRGSEVGVTFIKIVAYGLIYNFPSV